MKNNLLSTIVISLSIVIAAGFFSHAWIKSHSNQGSIKVMGAANENFTSDLITWKCDFHRKSMEMQEAFTNIKRDADLVKKFLIERGIAENEIIFSAISIAKDFTYIAESNGSSKSVFTGYSLIQSVEIESKNVDIVENVSRQITELINSNVEIYSFTPEYYYTRLAELKIKMIADATTDARIRAEKIAQNSNCKLGDMIDGNMGIFQIIARNSSEDFSWGGTFNTSAKYKTATITTRLTYKTNNGFRLW